MPTLNLPLGLGSRGDDVAKLQADLRKAGVTVPASEAGGKVFGVGTRDALLHFQAAHGLPATGVFDDATAAALAQVAADDGKYHVDGRVVFENGLPADGLTVRVYARGFAGAETRLAEVRADANGYYAAAFDLGSAAPNLEARTVDARGKEVRLSDTRFNAAKHEVFYLVAPDALRPLAPEFKRLTDDLGKQVGTLDKLAAAQETDGRRDLSLLYEATGWDARLVLTAAKAAGLAGQTGLAPDVLNAAFRVGLPTDPGELARVSADAFTAALQRANAAGIVALTDQQVAAAQRAFAAFARATRLAARAPGTLASPADLLQASGLNADQAAKFADLVLARTPPDDLWKQAAAQGIPQAQIAVLQIQGQLGYLTLNNVRLAEPIRQALGSPDNLARMVDLDLHKPKAWADRLNALAGNNEQELAKLIPPGYTQDKVADRRDAYAADLARQVRAAFPTQVVGRMIAADELRLGGDHAALKGPVGAALQKAAGLQFQLGRTPVGPFLRDHGAELFQGVPPEQVGPATQALKTLHRLYQITPTDEAMQALAGLGFRSAHDVVAFPPEVFVERFGGQFRSADEARLVHRKAQQVSAVAYNLFTGAKQITSAPDLLATAPPADTRAAARQKVRDDLVRQFPTLETLFGSLDFCACEECRSVLSPAAYLVDLFQFLDPDQAVWDSFLADWKARHGGESYDGPKYKFLKPFDALVERRPDLPFLELTCQNTNTAMPYIDLVNEALEYYVANDQLKPEAARQTGTAATPDLLAEPQNVEPKAYEALAAARYPLALPFDLWLETVRRLFDSAGTPLARVLEVFRPADELFAPAANPKPYYRAAVFAESLGLSPADVKLFTDPNPLAGWHALYGFDDPAKTAAQNQQDALAALASAKTLARRLGVSYEELVELFRTRFVNPRLDALALLRRLGLDVEDVFRFKKHAGYTPLAPDEEQAFADRLDRLTKQYNPNGDPNGFDARKALDAAVQGGQLDKVLVLAAPDASCDFDKVVPRFADTTPADALAFLKINLFVRLWRKLGWTIEETDRALCTFSPTKPQDLTAANLGPALQTALVYTAHLQALAERLQLGEDSRLRLLTFWSDLPTTGADPLYARLFLTPGVLKVDPVFDDPLGNYLPAPGVPLQDHLLGVQAGLNLTADEIRLVLADAGQSVGNTKLTLAIVSLLYRHGLLAKALRLTVRDLLALKRLSGLAPFKPLAAGPLTRLADDFPFTQTLAFLDVAEQVRATGFGVGALQYLFRHELLDPVGPYRPDPGALLGLVRSLGAGLRQIDADTAVPEGPAALTDDLVRQRLGLVLAPDVVEQFFGFWNDAVEFSAVKENVTPDRQLPAPVYQVDAIRVRYDATRQRQQVSHTGVLTAAKKAAVLAKVPVPPPDAPQPQKDAHANFLELLDQIGPESQKAGPLFFAEQFEGFVTYDDVLGAGAAGLSPEERRRKVLTAFRPFLRGRLVRRLVVQTLAAALSADPLLTEALLTEPAMLADPDQAGQPFLGLFAAAGEAGVTARFFASADGTGNPLATLTVAAPQTAAKPAGTNSARFEGYLEVPAGGAYRFSVVCGKKDTAVRLRFDHLADPLIVGSAGGDGAELSQFTELKPGVPYRFALDANKLGGGDVTLLVAADALPRGSLARLTLYPQSAVDRFDRGRTLLAKAFQLIQGFALSEREVRYVLTHWALFGGFDLGKLPARSADPAAAPPGALFGQFLRLAGYARLKRDLAGGSDDLVGVLEAAPPVAAQRLADLTRRDGAAVATTAALLGVSASDPATGLPRLWDALQVVERLGIPAGAVVAATKVVSPAVTPEGRYAIARDVRATVKARYGPDDWRRVAQPVFDALRRRQRDALVAYVLHRLGPKGIERAEQLFEYFLIDPGTEPVVQTSRLRLAISAVQTFVQRCFLNLEPRVHPSALNAEQWQWMKRYRVWEANRKIFLFPENWLEPELRDDKTYLFTELEGALLQGDVSADLAEGALLTYLKRLEEIARLQIVSVYADEDAGDPAATVLHVIGRTYTQPHRYFYRRFARQAWTAWEPVSAEVEGDHVTAVVWQGRLHLFWVTFLEKAARPNLTDDGGTTAAASLTLGQLKQSAGNSAVYKRVDLQLCWSTYHQGEWSARESSGFGVVRDVGVLADFDPASVFIHAAKEYEGGEERAVRIGLGVLSQPAQLDTAFRLVSRNGKPTAVPSATVPGVDALPYGTRKSATQDEGAGPLAVTFDSRVTTDTANSTSTILGSPSGNYSLVTCYNLLPAPAPGNVIFSALGTGDAPPLKPLIVPFFFQDELNTFYVEPTLTETTFLEWRGWGVGIPATNTLFTKDSVALVPLEANVPVRELPALPDGADGRLFTVRPRADWMVGPATALRFGDRLVGQTGGLDRRAFFDGRAIGTVVVGPGPADGLHPGNRLPVVADGLTVVGGGGWAPALLNRALARP